MKDQLIPPQAMRRRAMNALRSMEKREAETKPNPKACPKCGRTFLRGLHLHTRKCLK